MKLGLRYVREHHFLIPFFVFTGSVLFFIAPVAFLTPLQVVRDFGEEIWRLSAIEIAFSGGMAIGGFLVAVWNGFRNRIVTMIYALLVMAAVTIGLGVIETFWIYLALMVVIGVSLPFYNTPAIVMIQEKVDPAFMGRVLAVMGMITGSAMQLGLVAFGPLADVVAIDWLLVGSGVVLLALSALTLANRKLVASGVAPVKTAPPPVPAQG
jgi:DHA3 family macrolide efflux protein-like MFS transporter